MSASYLSFYAIPHVVFTHTELTLNVYAYVVASADITIIREESNLDETIIVYENGSTVKLHANFSTVRWFVLLYQFSKC